LIAAAILAKFIGPSDKETHLERCGILKSAFRQLLKAVCPNMSAANQITCLLQSSLTLSLSQQITKNYL